MSVLVPLTLFYTVVDTIFWNLPGDVFGSTCISPVWLEWFYTHTLSLLSLSY